MCRIVLGEYLDDRQILDVACPGFRAVSSVAEVDSGSGVHTLRPPDNRTLAVAQDAENRYRRASFRRIVR